MSMVNAFFQTQSYMVYVLWTEWHENGQMKREGLYVNGMRHYTWEKWNDTGELIYREWNHVFL